MVSRSLTTPRWLYLHSRRHPKNLRHQGWSRLCCPRPRLPDRCRCLENLIALYEPLMVWALRHSGFQLTTPVCSSNTKLSVFLPHRCKTCDQRHQNDLMGHSNASRRSFQPLNCNFLPLKVSALRCCVAIRQRLQRWHRSLRDWTHYCSHHCAQRRLLNCWRGLFQHSYRGL